MKLKGVHCLQKWEGFESWGGASLQKKKKKLSSPLPQGNILHENANCGCCGPHLVQAIRFLRKNHDINKGPIVKNWAYPKAFLGFYLIVLYYQIISQTKLDKEI